MTDNTNAVNTAPRGGFFYFLLATAALIVFLFPVGIANAVFGYMMGDSPCTLCWGQRIAMIFIALCALFIVRFGFKPRYIASLLIFTAVGLWQSFRHIAPHAGRDLDQGFGLMVLGAHTYFWAEVVFWAVVILLGVMFFFAPRDLGPVHEDGNNWRTLTFWGKICFFLSALVLASNCLQAAVSTGLPPNYGQGDPIRFSWNPKHTIHTSAEMAGNFKTVSVYGKRDVKAPDYAFAPNAANLGIKFDHEAANGPLTTSGDLKIVSEDKINISLPLNTLSLINGEYVVSSKNNVFFLNKDLKIVDEFEMDPLYSATIDPTIGIIPWKDGKYILMGSNKTFMKFQKSVTDNPDKQLIGRYSDFVKGEDHFLASGRGRVSTIRSQFSHVMSSAADGEYNYMATVPNNRDKKTFVISKQLLNDMVTSGEFTPKTSLLKDGRSLGELYVTGLSVFDGKLYAVSKNYNCIFEIDPKAEVIEKAFALPNTLDDVRGLIVDKDGFKVLNHNVLITLK